MLLKSGNKLSLYITYAQYGMKIAETSAQRLSI
jgi:hypothetical protein